MGSGALICIRMRIAPGRRNTWSRGSRDARGVGLGGRALRCRFRMQGFPVREEDGGWLDGWELCLGGFGGGDHDGRACVTSLRLRLI